MFYHIFVSLSLAQRVVLNGNVDLQPNEIIATAKKSLANYKIPKEVVFVKELPRNAMGKVQKNVLREKFFNLRSS